MAFTKLLRKATKSTRAAVKAAEEAAERAAKKKKKTAPKPKRGGKQVELEGARANPETGGSDKVGIRVPDHPVALKIIKIVGPITSTSANLHGHPEPKNINIAMEQLGDEVMLYFDCGECKHKSASTVVDISDSSIKVIRKGVISENTLLALTTMQS